MFFYIPCVSVTQIDLQFFRLTLSKLIVFAYNCVFYIGAAEVLAMKISTARCGARATVKYRSWKAMPLIITGISAHARMPAGSPVRN